MIAPAKARAVTDTISQLSLACLEYQVIAREAGPASCADFHKTQTALGPREGYYCLHRQLLNVRSCRHFQFSTWIVPLLQRRRWICAESAVWKQVNEMMSVRLLVSSS